MSLLDFYYQYEKSSMGKARTRRDLVAHTGVYPPLHIPNGKGEIFIYCQNDTSAIRIHGKRKPSHRISCAGNHITSIFKEPDTPMFGYGDIQHTQDGCLTIHSGSDSNMLEIFICKGKKSTIQAIYLMLIDGELHEEITSLKGRAMPVKSSQGNLFEKTTLDNLNPNIQEVI